MYTIYNMYTSNLSLNNIILLQRSLCDRIPITYTYMQCTLQIQGASIKPPFLHFQNSFPEEIKQLDDLYALLFLSVPIEKNLENLFRRQPISITYTLNYNLQPFEHQCSCLICNSLFLDNKEKNVQHNRWQIVIYIYNTLFNKCENMNVWISFISQKASCKNKQLYVHTIHPYAHSHTCAPKESHTCA